jgi:hypothetical protein
MNCVVTARKVLAAACEWANGISPKNKSDDVDTATGGLRNRLDMDGELVQCRSKVFLDLRKRQSGVKNFVGEAENLIS